MGREAGRSERREVEKRKSECRIYERCCGSERLAGK